MSRQQPFDLSRRERQILEILYRLGQGSALEVTAQMSDAPTSTTVRSLLRVLERKGHVRHHLEGVRFIYTPVMPRASAGPSALIHVVRTFFNGSPSAAMAALLGKSSGLPDDELERLARLFERARKGR
jgi:predicted transcriptional regulator